MSQPQPIVPARRLVEFPRGVQDHLGISQKTAYNYAKLRYFQLYEFAGQRGVFVDLNEVDAGMAKLPPSKAKAGRRRFGGAPVIQLPAQPVVVGRDAQ